MRCSGVRLSSLPSTLRSILSHPSASTSTSTATSAFASSSSSSSRPSSRSQARVREETDSPPSGSTTVRGWIRSIRSHKNVTFLEVNDGSQVGGIQAVLKGKGRADGLTNGSSVRMRGTLGKSRGSGQAVELLVEDLVLVGECDPEAYPIQKKSLPLSILRDNAHLRFRTTQTAAVMRIRDALTRDWHDWFEDNGFIHIHTPVLTGSDCEGAGEVFTLHDPGAVFVSRSSASSPLSSLTSHASTSSSTAQSMPQPFFPHLVHLTVSSQLHLEAPTHALSRTYTLSPAFRAEPSLTSRHLSEFYMLEAEVAWVDDLDRLLDVVEDGVRSNVAAILAEAPAVEEGGEEATRSSLGRGRGKRVREDLEAIAKSLIPEDDAQNQNTTVTQQSISPNDPLGHLRQVLVKPFTRITYTTALDLLSELHSREAFVARPPRWGEPIATEHEKRLAMHFGGPVFVTRYPRSIKPFYMLPTEATSSSTTSSSAFTSSEPAKGREDTVECFDLLFPHLGEMAGGSLREHRLPNLLQAISQAGMKEEEYEWYLDLRRFGSVPHGGWGMGWDRWVCWVTGVGNVRDVVPFARWKGHCKY